MNANTATTITITAQRDIDIQALVQTTAATADITLTADTDGDGVMDGLDSLANHNFDDRDYDELTPEEQEQVDLVFYNLMCYRYRRERLSPGQLDRMTDASNTTVNHVATGRTHFVDDDGDGENQSGSSTEPYITVADGLEAAGSGDIVLIRAGTYDESLTIDQRVYLRASRGNAVIRGAP